MIYNSYEEYLDQYYPMARAAELEARMTPQEIGALIAQRAMENIRRALGMHAEGEARE